MERLASPSNYPPAVGRFRQEQVAHRGNWSGVPDRDVLAAAMHVIHVVPHGASTVTLVNPLDPGTVSDPEGYVTAGWLERPGALGTVVPAGRWS